MSLTDVDRLRYANGVLYWERPKSNRIRKGDVAGTEHGNGYLKVRLGDKVYYAHRLVYYMHHGWMPEQIDHINGNRSDNRIDNLRAATKSQNALNSRMPKNNTSGVKNVSWCKSTSADIAARRWHSSPRPVAASSLTTHG